MIPLSPAPRLRHSRAPLSSFPRPAFVIPAPRFRHSRPPLSSFPPPRFRHSRPPLSSFPRPAFVIPAPRFRHSRPPLSSFPPPPLSSFPPPAFVIPAPRFRHSRPPLSSFPRKREPRGGALAPTTIPSVLTPPAHPCYAPSIAHLHNPIATLDRPNPFPLAGGRLGWGCLVPSTHLSALSHPETRPTWRLRPHNHRRAQLRVVHIWNGSEHFSPKSLPRPTA